MHVARGNWSKTMPNAPLHPGPTMPESENGKQSDVLRPHSLASLREILRSLLFDFRINHWVCTDELLDVRLRVLFWYDKQHRLARELRLSILLLSLS
mmetsp:Transcript_5849/g.14835  ORF Transcript_5849/g.14835 Transcript_5849/m.14835 type:complete len:97 (-) Transcript_5849:382-672(-)